MATPLRVLILEDRPADAELMVHELRRAGLDPDWRRVEDEPDYLAALEPTLDVILADYSLPQYNAMRALRSLQERGLDVPFVVVTGSISEEVAVECMKQGAADYLLKDRLTRLGPAVLHALEQRRLRREKHQADELFHLQGAVLEAAANAIVVTDRDGRIAWVNSAFTRLTGYTLAEVWGQNPRLVKSGQHDLLLYRDLWGTILAGRVWHGEMINRRKDGSLYTEEQTITPVWNQRGEISHFVAIKQDITDRKQAEEEISSLAKFPAESPYPVLRLDHDGKVLYGNEASEALLRQWGSSVGAPAPPEWRELVHETLASRSGRTTDVQCGQRIYSLFVAPIPEAGYVNLYGRDITDRKQAEEALMERTRQLEAVRAVSVEITRELDLTTLLTLISRRAIELVQGTSGTIFLWDGEGQVLVPGAWPGFGEWRREVRQALGEGVAGAVAIRREGMIVNDYRTSPYAHPLIRERTGIAAVLAEPLLYRDQLVGVITVNDKGTGRQFGERDRELLALFATQAAIAIENARLYAKSERAAREAQSLYEVAHSLATSLDLSEVLHLVTVKTTELLGTPHAQVVLWDETTQTLRLGAVYGSEAENVKDQTFRLGEGVNGIVAQSRVPLVVNDYQTFSHRVAERTEIVADIGVPLLYRDRFLGVLNSHATNPRSAFTQEHVALLTSFANQAAMAIENARLYEAERRRTAELQAVMEVSRDIVMEQPLATLLHDVVHRAIALTGAHSGTLYMWDEAGQALVPHAWANLGDYVRGVRYALGQGITGAAAQAGQALIWNDYSGNPGRDPQILEHVALSACMAAPLTVQGRLIGALSLNHEAGRQFAESDLRLLETFARQMAVAIENARMYQERRLAAIQLEAIVEDRTLDLRRANTQLQEAMAQVEEASRNKSAFLANMSHELRTPLNSIIGFSQLLLEQAANVPTEKQTRYLTHIENGGQHLLQLISDILDLSKVEAGKIVLEPQILLVAQTLEDILVIGRGLAHKKAQEVQADIAPGLPFLRADPVRFKQILFNLLSNAVKFTPNGGRITVTARAVTEERRPETGAEWLEITVTDTGIGIRAEDLPRLFQEFVQLETTQAQKHEGTGLGLALTKRLVELHGGRIRAESEGEGRGSTFTILLPFERSEG